MSLPRRLGGRADLIIGVVVGAATFALYVKTLAPTVLMADAAEFQLACYLGGIAHPTGYPLYLMLGWLWSHLVPLGDAAYRINLLSALFATLAVGLLYPLILLVLETAVDSLSRRSVRAVAVIATLSLAVSRTFWSQALRAEVYALNSLFVVAILFLLLLWSRTRSHRTLSLAALVYGLGLTHHRTIILLLPACVLFVWFTERSALTDLKSLGKLLLLILVPQLLYLYIPLRAPATSYLHIDLAPGRTLELYDNTPGGFLGFVMGEMFRGELGLKASLWERLTMAAASLVKEFGIAGIALGLLGVVKLAIGRPNAASRRVLVLLGVSYLGIVGFTLVYFIGDIHVFYTPSYIIFAVWMAVGMAWIIEAVRNVRFSAFPRAWRLSGYVLIGLFTLLPLSSLWNNCHRVARSDDYRARQWAEEILSQPIPEGAILVSNDRNEIIPLLYLQHAEGVRPDLITMFPLMLPGEEYSNVVRVIDGVIDLGRPIYLVKPMPGIEIKYQMEPFGPLVQVAGPAITGEPERSTNLAVSDSLVLIGYDLDPEPPRSGEELHVTLYWGVKEDLAEDYHSYVHLVDEEGNVVAQSDHQPGGSYYPTSLWQPAEMLLDEHVFAIPIDGTESTLQLLAGMYLYPSLEPLGELPVLGRLDLAR